MCIMKPTSLTGRVGQWKSVRHSTVSPKRIHDAALPFRYVPARAEIREHRRCQSRLNKTIAAKGRKEHKERIEFFAISVFFCGQ